MDPKKLAEKPAKVDSAFNIQLKDEKLSTQYTKEVQQEARITSTGHLVILRLSPLSSASDLPSFVVRWDQAQDTVDVDMEGRPDKLKDFRSGQNGYHGHRTHKVSKAPRMFKIDIRIPGFSVYEALLGCNINRSVLLKESVKVDVAVTSEVLPGQRSESPHWRSNFLRYYLPVILWAAVIAGLSTSGFDTSFTLKVLRAANDFLELGFSLARLREINAVVRKLGHVTEYFILGLLLWRALRRGREAAWRWSWALGTLALGAAWAGLDELHQRFERGRGSSIIDVGWDSLGLLLAVVLILIVAWRKKKGRARSPALPEQA